MACRSGFGSCACYIDTGLPDDPDSPSYNPWRLLPRENMWEWYQEFPEQVGPGLDRIGRIPEPQLVNAHIVNKAAVFPNGNLSGRGYQIVSDFVNGGPVTIRIRVYIPPTTFQYQPYFQVAWLQWNVPALFHSQKSDPSAAIPLLQDHHGTYIIHRIHNDQITQELHGTSHHYQRMVTNGNGYNLFDPLIRNRQYSLFFDALPMNTSYLQGFIPAGTTVRYRLSVDG